MPSLPRSPALRSPAAGGSGPTTSPRTSTPVAQPGCPQLVPLTHGNQVYQAWGMALMFRTRPASTLLMGLPLFHVGGALTQGLQHLSAGGTLVVLSAQGWRNKSAMPNIWRLVGRYKPELLGGVPTVLGAVLAVPIEGLDVSSVRKVTGAARPSRFPWPTPTSTASAAGARDVRHDRGFELPHDLVLGAPRVSRLGRSPAALQQRARRRGG
jgi:acyl-CoA synthetase (AMP-forming)/AMP-acid ligase II